jgi:transcriptional regulator with XRE-family HTH domain
MPAGRPTKYEPRFCDELIKFMGKGYSLTAFAGKIGVARSTINEWMSANPEFSEATRVGQAKRTMALETTLLAGETGPKVTGHMFALKNADPEGWRDKQEVEHSGGVTVVAQPLDERI